MRGDLLFFSPSSFLHLGCLDTEREEGTNILFPPCLSFFLFSFLSSQVASIEGELSEVVETSCDKLVIASGDTIYELSDVDLGSRELEFVDMSADDCRREGASGDVPDDASCYRCCMGAVAAVGGVVLVLGRSRFTVVVPVSVVFPVKLILPAKMSLSCFFSRTCTYFFREQWDHIP